MGAKPGNTYPSIRAGNLICLLLALLLSHPLLAQQASVRSELSASTITRDESVTLTVTAVGVDGELDSSALDKDFEVVGQSSSRQIRTVVNGSNQPVTVSLVTWSLELLPRETGVFTIPAVTVGGVSSQLLSLTVNEIPSGVRRDVFVEASVDARNPWVQSQVLMTVRVFQAIEIVEGGLSDPAGVDLLVQRIGKDSYATEVRDGREYRVTERRFAVFPQKSGTISIEPVVLSVSVPTDTKATLGFFSPTRKLTRRSDTIRLDVQARPSTGAAWWLPANAVQIDSHWADDVSKAVVDQPLTRTIVVRAGGVLDSQLPDIRIPAIDGGSLYAEEPVLAMGMNEQGLVAEQTIKWALIPQREGELILPELRIEWFNTDSGNTETAVLPEERIQVGPSAAATVSQVAPVPRVADDNSVSREVPGTGDAAASSLAQDAASDGANATGGLPERVASGVSTEATVPAGVTNTDLNAGLDRTVPGSERQNLDTTTSRSAELAGGISSRPWRLATLLLAGLWVLSLFAFWGWRRRLHDGRVSPSDGSSGQLSGIGHSVRKTRQKLAPMAEVEASCRANDPVALRAALLAWAASQWPQQPPPTLTDLALRLQEGSARQSLAALDAALYSRAPAPEERDTLMLRMRTLPADLSMALASRQDNTTGDHAYPVAASGRRGKGLPAL